MKNNKKIIIADQDITIISILQLILKENGFDPISTTSGTTCLELINKTQPPKLLLLDTNITDISLDRIITTTREIHATLPILLLNKNPTHKLINSSHIRYCHGIIYKPFDAEELLNFIKQILNSTRKWEHK